MTRSRISLWANQLERAGVQVVYGFIEWKTHAKISMVVRREGQGYRTYCHFGTGNYHPVTARIYTDLSFFTADPRAGRDAAQLFNYITGYVEPERLDMITMSPLNMRAHLCDLIDAEIVAASAGQPSGVWAKMNSLVDPDISTNYTKPCRRARRADRARHLLSASGGARAFRNDPGQIGRGRFLEHSRVGSPWRVLRTSAAPISAAPTDAAHFDRRVEHMIPIENPTVHDQILTGCWSPT